MMYADPPERQRQQPPIGDVPALHDIDRYGVRPPLVAKNVSGASVPVGSLILFTTTSTVERWFTTSATLGDDRICGMTLDTIGAGQVGPVAVDGYVRQIRTVSGTTRGQFLRQSTSAGVAEGTAIPTHGSHAQAITNRDANGYVEAIIMHMHGATTVYDSISSTAINYSYWDSFEGRAAAVTSSERYVATASGASAPTFAVESTTGVTHLRLGVNLNVATEYTYFTFGLTLSPRAAEDWGFKAILGETTAPVIGTGDLHYLVGFLETETSETSDGIYFRSLDSANWFLVCRNAATETTVDLGVAADTTRRLLEFRITGGGTSVQAYVDGILTGAAITTNIPTNRMTAVEALALCSADITTAGILGMFGWGIQSGN